MPRQSVTVSAISTGTVPATAPKPPAAICRPLAKGRRPLGSHMAKALNAPIRHAAVPNPIKARPAIRPPAVAALAKMKQPSPANSNKAASVRLGP